MFNNLGGDGYLWTSTCRLPVFAIWNKRFEWNYQICTCAKYIYIKKKSRKFMQVTLGLTWLVQMWRYHDIFKKQLGPTISHHLLRLLSVCISQALGRQLIQMWPRKRCERRSLNWRCVTYRSQCLEAAVGLMNRLIDWLTDKPHCH